MAILVAKIALVAILVAKIAVVAKLLWWQWRRLNGVKGGKPPYRAKLLFCRNISGLVGNLTRFSMFILLLCFDRK